MNRKNQFWNGQPRHSTAMTYFDAFESKLNGQDFDILLELPQIFVNIMADDQNANKNESSSKKSSRSRETNKFLVEELEKEGKEELTNYILESLRILTNELKHGNRLEKHTIFQFLIKKIDLTMTTLNLEPFLHAHLETLRLKMHITGGASNSTKVSMQRIEIVKCKEMPNLDLSRDNLLLQNANYSDARVGAVVKDTHVLRIMYDDKMDAKDPTRLIEEIEFKGTRGSPTQIDKRKRALQVEQYKIWSKGAFNLEQTVFNIDAKNMAKAKEKGLNPKWTVVSSLEISTKPLEVIVDNEILKFFREYLLVREWNNILKVIQKKDDQVETVG